MMFRRYAEVARKLAKEEQGSVALMWAELSALWDRVADRTATKEAQLTSRLEE